MSRTTALMAIFVALISKTVLADVDVNFGIEEWQNDVEEFTTIDFTQYPPETVITNQYSNLGITFTEGDEIITAGDVFMDGSGLRDFDSGLPEPDNIWMAFDESITAIAVDFPGIMQFELFQNGESVFVSDPYDDDAGGFLGLVSDFSFDEVRIWNPMGSTHIDNLHFAPPIPAPGALGLFAFGSIVLKPRRRRK